MSGSPEQADRHKVTDDAVPAGTDAPSRHIGSSVAKAKPADRLDRPQRVPLRLPRSHVKVPGAQMVQFLSEWLTA